MIDNVVVDFNRLMGEAYRLVGHVPSGWLQAHQTLHRFLVEASIRATDNGAFDAAVSNMRVVTMRDCMLRMLRMLRMYELQAGASCTPNYYARRPFASSAQFWGARASLIEPNEDTSYLMISG